MPWAWGADPRDGRAACCFKTAQAAREELGLSWPADRMSDWYTRAKRGEWESLYRDWTDMTKEIKKPVAGALLKFDNADGGFGVGVLLEPEIIATVRHQGRLLVVPRKALGLLKLYQLR